MKINTDLYLAGMFCLCHCSGMSKSIVVIKNGKPGVMIGESFAPFDQRKNKEDAFEPPQTHVYCVTLTGNDVFKWSGCFESRGFAAAINQALALTEGLTIEQILNIEIELQS